MCSTILFMELF
nr:unnamed protein product [Callosobruchus chinensis]